MDVVELWHLGAGIGVALLVLLFSWLIYILMKRSNELKIADFKLQTNIAQLASLNQALQLAEDEAARAKDALNKTMDEYKRVNEALHKAHVKEATIEARLQAELKSYEKLESSFKEQSKQLELKLNSIMQEGLEQKLKKFDENSLKSLDSLLKPLGQNLESFKRKIEMSQEESTKKFAELSKEIEFVAKAGLNISQEAQNLTNALKGKKQTQGSWGEMILETVLEYSGLLRGVHYETQSSFRDEDGKHKRPDVVIKLPKNRSIIIDSKVSLNDYDAYIRSQNEQDKTLTCKALVRAFKNHIDTLESKDYAHYDVKTLQYVFMFVPIEGAFALALQEDPSLYEYALKKHIAIVTPATLTVSLRTIYLYWQSEQSSYHAQALFSEAGKLYDKIAIFAQTYERFGAQLQALHNTYESGQKQLSQGQGNILNRVQKLQSLGAKTTKKLKTASFDSEDFDESPKEVIYK